MSWSDKRLFMDSDICGLLVDTIQDFDASDNKGNTLLLTLARLLHSDYSNDEEYSQLSSDDEEYLQISSSYEEYSQVSSIIKTLKFLISQGAYIYTRTNEKKTAIDYLADFAQKKKASEDAHKLFEMLKSQIPSLQSLAKSNTFTSKSSSNGS